MTQPGSQPEPATEAFNACDTIRHDIVRLAGQRNDYHSQLTAAARQNCRLQQRIEELIAENNTLRAQVSQHVLAP